MVQNTMNSITVEQRPICQLQITVNKAATYYPFIAR